MMRPSFPALLLAASVLLAGAVQGRAEEIDVDVRNRSEPELCAERDNVALEFASPAVRSFRVQAVHPAFIGSILADRWAPDFTSCDMSHDPVFFADKSRRVTFFETPEFWLTGYTYPSFWRPASVPVRVGDRVETGLHIIQLWVRFQERAEEVLVLYPPDGYWRIRPLPPPGLRWTAYGSSFLVGPVEVQERPVVALKDIAFDPKTASFTLNFARGGSARVTLKGLDQDRIVLDVQVEGDTPPGLPFASMRSMYTTEYNADVARAAWRTKGGAGWGESHIMSYPGGPASELWAGRTVLSRHNTSAPDMVFSRFSTLAPAPDRHVLPNPLFPSQPEAKP
jgi:hypothetical protein